MPSITIRNVSDDTRNVLAARAASSGKSLQEYLRAELTELAAKPTMAEWVARVREHRATLGGGATTEQILEAVHEGRR